MMTTDEQLAFDAPPDDPVTAYLACGLTSLNDDQTTVVELVSGLVSEFCSAAGVRVHQPVLHTHPRDHQDLTPAQVHAVDYGAVLESDVLIGIGDYASWGAGKELAWAERARTPVLMLLHKDRTMSRLVTGSSGDITIAPWRYPNDIREEWTTYFVKRKAQLEAHRRVRADRRDLWAAPHTAISSEFGRRNADERDSIAAITQLTRSRIEEMLSRPTALACASG